MTRSISRRSFAAGVGTIALAAPLVARGQGALTKVRYTMDWAFQGPIAFAILGRDKGFFREAGVDIALSCGFGGGRVPVDIAAGAYEMGQADINPTLKFMAENPDRGLVVIAITSDRSPLLVVSHADGPVKMPKDLEGRTLAAPEFDAARQMFPAFARAASIDASKIKWLSVQPELREPMLVQKRADAITGFITSAGISLKALGMDWPQQRHLFYRDYGLDLYSHGIITTRDFLQRQPDAARGTVRAMLRSLIYAYRNAEEAIQALKRAEPLTDVPIEMERLKINDKYLTVTDNVLRNGLSSVDPQRLERSIRAIEASFGLKTSLKPADVYIDAFLPPREQRML